MKTRIKLSVILVSIILMVMFTGTTVNAAVLGSSAAIYSAKAETVDYTVGSFKEYCDALNKAALGMKDTVKVKINVFDKKVYDDKYLTDKLESSNPELFYLENLDYSWKTAGGKAVIMTVKLTYSYPKDKLAAIRKEVDTKATDILKRIISPDMPLRDKELAIHDYVAANVKFDNAGQKSGKYPVDSYNPYGALLKGTANSIGYARSMHLLLNRAGLESLIVYGENATWNMVKLEGEYYHLDACGDNIEGKDGKIILVHDYYNISDEEMSKKNKWDKSRYPKCASMKANFFYMNNTFAESYDGYLRVLREGIDDVRDVVSVKVANYNEKDYELFKALYKIVDDYPDLDYIDFDKSNYYSNDELGVINVVICYDQPKEKLISMKIEVESQVNKIVNSIIKPEMTEYDKEKAIHDYLIFNAKYNKAGAEKNDVPFEEHDAYGVLVKGIGVCDSYAEAFKMILNKAGIECITVIGDQKDGKDDDIGHAWSMVKIDGKYYQVDVTWDDREYDDGQNDLCYDYFNITDEDMAKDHTWDEKLYPDCTSKDANYFYLNKRAVAKNQVENILRSSLSNEEVVVHLKVTDYNSGNFDIRGLLSRLINSRFHKAKSVSWTTNDIQGVLKITFQY